MEVTPKFLIDDIVKSLLSHEYKRIDTSFDEIERGNRMLKGHKQMAFMYAGEVYYNTKADTVYVGASIPTLSLQFTEAMVNSLDQKKQLNRDAASIKQMLFRLLHPCNSPQDVRDALPECLVRFLPDKFSNLSRTNNDGYNLPDDRARRQYNKVKEKIEFYSATSLIY